MFAPNNKVILILALSMLALVASPAAAAILSGGVPDPTYSGNSLQLWLRPESISESGGTVTGWSDESMHARAYTVNGSPAYVGSGIGGLPSVLFDGTDDEIVHGADFLGAGADYTYLVVFNTNSTANQRLTGTGHADLQITGGKLESRIWNGSYMTVTDTATVSTGQDYLGITSWASGAQRVGVDGTFTPGSITTLTFGRTSFHVGVTPAADFFSGTIAEVLVYDQPLSDSDLNEVGFYLADKYGIDTAFVGPAPFVPEPATLVLVGMGGVAVALSRRCRKRDGSSPTRR